jgi:hypothetical protein
MGGEPAIELPVYIDVRNRALLLRKGSEPHPALESFPDPYKCIHAVVQWLGDTLYADSDHFYLVKRLGKTCVQPAPKKIKQHHKQWKESRQPGLYLIKGKYLKLTFKGPSSCKPAQIPKIIDVHDLICTWAWGRKTLPKQQCCHYICDKHDCLNARHLR